jgi:hypothetical protein
MLYPYYNDISLYIGLFQKVNECNKTVTIYHYIHNIGKCFITTNNKNKIDELKQIILPTSAPTTSSPTQSPTTPSPTNYPTTFSPTMPTTLTPTRVPTTQSPSLTNSSSQNVPNYLIIFITFVIFLVKFF